MERWPERLLGFRDPSSRGANEPPQCHLRHVLSAPPDLPLGARRTAPVRASCACVDGSPGVRQHAMGHRRRNSDDTPKRAPGDVMDQAEVDGLRIAYERAGQGEPLVLVHGYVGDGRSCWRRQMEALSDEFTVVAWDAPGTGRSSDPPESFGMHGYADCLAAFIDRLGLGGPTSRECRSVGHSRSIWSIGIQASRERLSWRPHTPDGQVHCRLTWPRSASSKPCAFPSSHRSNSSTRCSQECSRLPRQEKIPKRSVRRSASFIRVGSAHWPERRSKTCAARFPHRCPNAPGLWRPGRARAVERGRRPPRVDLGIRTRGALRCRSRMQHRSRRPVQRCRS